MAKDKTIVVHGENNIRMARLLSLKGMLKLELRGMKRRGRSAYAIIKEETGFTGSKQRVLDQLEAFTKEQLPDETPDLKLVR
jgi:hypothetical protein